MAAKKTASTLTEAAASPVPAKKAVKAKKERSTSTRGHYVTNAQLLPEIAACKANNNTLSPKLAKMLWMIAERYSYSASFANYSFREDMVSIAVLNLCANWHKFDLTRENPNPFSFYTTSAYRSFLQYLAHEKDHRDIRDALLVDAGANPSFNYDGGRGMSHDDTAFRGSNSGE